MKMNLALDNRQRLICHKTQLTNQPSIVGETRTNSKVDNICGLQHIDTLFLDMHKLASIISLRRLEST